MMVMRFDHPPDYDQNQNFKSNWPSPIVFHDQWKAGQEQDPAVMAVDYDNLESIDVSEFRVFNNDLYHEKYHRYHNAMPPFTDLHKTRKSAGVGSMDQETPTDSMAFQGTFRIKDKSGTRTQEILGSGHHGPDYVGVSSVRAGKGQKTMSAAPTVHRLI